MTLVKNLALKANAESKINGNPPKEVIKNSVASAEKKEIPLPVIIPQKRENPTSIEDRFYRLDVLFSLREKHDKLKESLDKVTKLKLSTDGRTDNIIIKDASGITFSTFNGDVFIKVVDWLKEDLSAKLKEVEAQITL